MDQVPEKQSRNRKINKNVFISYKRLLDEILSLKKTTLKANISKCILVHLKNPYYTGTGIYHRKKKKNLDGLSHGIYYFVTYINIHYFIHSWHISDERLNFQTACVTNTSFMWITLFTRSDACQGQKINKWWKVLYSLSVLYCC